VTPAEYFNALPTHVRQPERERLAALAGLDPETIRAYESGARQPSDADAIAALVKGTSGHVQPWEWAPRLEVLFTPGMRAFARRGRKAMVSAPAELQGRGDE
jgi:hypothetical protein